VPQSVPGFHSGKISMGPRPSDQGGLVISSNVRASNEHRPF